jgi:hypothetical protein
VKGEAFDDALEIVDVVRHKPKGRINYDQSSIDNSTICPKSDLLRVTKVALFVKAIAAILIASCCNPFYS